MLNFFFNHLHVSRKLLILNFQNLETFEVSKLRVLLLFQNSLRKILHTIVLFFHMDRVHKLLYYRENLVYTNEGTVFFLFLNKTDKITSSSII